MKPLPCAPEHWPEFSALLDRALALSIVQRPGFLASEVPAHLREALDRVLAADAAGPQLEGPPAPVDTDISDFSPGLRLGPWRLLRPLGRGGMGEVWLAARADGAYERELALKLPHAFALMGQGRARFARERDILAALQHRHIAQFFDAGSDPLPSGDLQPWLALEYVAGEPITRYAQRLQLSLRERLCLLLQVMEAVQHAHGRLLVHRDLKPANLLVTAQGEIKLLDFGIAKLLGPETRGSDLTRLTLATPAYAAPEQLQGGAIGVAVDIYALGVLLHELLTGCLPQPARAASELAPDRSIARQLRGDLDALIAKALAAAPEQRYASVQALADDVQRWLICAPLRVRRAGPLERLGKTWRRHWLGFSALTAVLLSLGLGFGATAWQASQTAVEARRAETIKNYLLDLIKTLDPRAADASQPEAAMRRMLKARLAEIEHALPADTETAEQLLGLAATLQVYLGDARHASELAARRWDMLKQRLGPGASRSMGAGMALAWALLAEERGEAFEAVLRELDGSLPAAGLLRAEWWLARHALLELRGASAAERGRVLRQALSLYERDAPRDSGHPTALRLLGQLALSQGQAPKALERFDQALALQAGAEPYIAVDHVRLLLLRSRALRALGRVEAMAADEAQARRLLGSSMGLDSPLARRLLDEHAAQ